jgi:hypothetical protein
MFKTVASALFLAVVGLSVPAQAQGVPGGAAHGFHEGNRIAGPVGAVVGTAVGGVIGGVEGVLGVNQTYAAPSDAPVVRHRTYRRHAHRRYHKTHRPRHRHLRHRYSRY